MTKIRASELILTDEGSIYHLRLHPEDLADNVILVGDPGRVPEVSSFFDKIELKVSNREICTHTGFFNNKRVTVLSTGMGTDNIDIVVNELDALVNIDLGKRELKNNHTSLNLIRLGTSGALQADLNIDEFMVSEYGLGLDGILYFYEDSKNVIEKEITTKFINELNWSSNLPKPYVVKGSENLIEKIGFGMKKGITATAPGFYGPQGRELRLKLAFPNINNSIEEFSYNGLKINNLEMETSALYGLGKMLGHETLTVCVLIANRVTKQFSKDYKKPMKNLIEQVLYRITS